MTAAATVTIASGHPSLLAGRLNAIHPSMYLDNFVTISVDRKKTSIVYERLDVNLYDNFCFLWLKLT